MWLRSTSFIRWFCKTGDQFLPAMIKLNGFKFIFTVLLFTACNRISINRVDLAADSVKIFKTVLLSENFQKEIPDEIDTIYLLKSNYYSSSWPGKLADLSIDYIEDKPENRVTNYPGVKKLDNRFRYVIPFFKIENDLAEIYCYEFNGRIDFKYKLQKKGDEWAIISEEIGME